MATDLIDPFDSEKPFVIQKKEQRAYSGDLVDPFDNPELSQSATSGPERSAAEKLDLSQKPPEYTRDPEMGAPLSDNIMLGLADDPMVKEKYLAEQRSPGDEWQAGVNYFTTPDGEILYRKDGKWYSEQPRMIDRAAAKAGEWIAPAVGTGVGVATAPMAVSSPMGMAASVGLTAGATSTAERARQELGKKYLGDPVDLGQVATETGFSIAGDTAGGLVTRYMGRNVARDISRMSSEDVAILQGLSQKYGIDLTPAELTNLPSLKAKQKALGNIVETSDDMGDFYIKRAGQVDEAVGKYLDDISPVDSAEVAGKDTVDAARGAIKDARKARSDAAGPLYEVVNDPDSLIDPAAFKPIADDEYLADIIKGVKSNKLYGMRDYPDNSLPVIDQAKKDIDDLIEVAKGQGEMNKVRLLEKKRKTLTDVADKAFPEYPEARAAFAGESPEVDTLEKGIVGIISKLKDTNAQQAARKLFSPSVSGPGAVRTAKKAIMKADPDAWQAIKRSYVQDIWAKASKEFATTENLKAGAKFRALLLGDSRQKAILREALSPEEYKALDDLSKVFEATGRVKHVGSDTAWNQEMMRLEKEAATPWTAKATRLASPWKWQEMVENWMTENAVQENAARMLEIITSPDGLKAMRELRKVSPNSARAAVLAAHLTGILSVEGAPVAYEAMKEGLE